MAVLERQLTPSDVANGRATDVHGQARSNAAAPSPVAISFGSKRHHTANFLAGDSGDRIDLELLFRNDTEKPIRAFKGIVEFRDLFDDLILTVNLTFEGGIRPRATTTWRGGIEYNQFIAGHTRLLTISPQDLRTSLVVESVISQTVRLTGIEQVSAVARRIVATHGQVTRLRCSGCEHCGGATVMDRVGRCFAALLWA
jgi:hypothetical protein